MSTLLITHPACLDHLTPHGPSGVAAIAARGLTRRSPRRAAFKTLAPSEAPRPEPETIALCHPMRLRGRHSRGNPQQGMVGIATRSS